ncbi:MAG: PilN domain-containing protein [Limnohabitans sp.]
MSQQINLLLRPRSGLNPVVWSVLIVALAVLALLGTWLYFRQHNEQLQAQLTRMQATNAGLRADIVRMTSSDDELTRIKAEIALLQPQYEAVKDFVANVRSGPLGRPEGFAPMLQLLAQVRTTDTWLTSIELRHRGRNMALAGLALSEQAAAAYGAQVNQALQGSALSLQGLELVRQGERQADPNGLPATVAFRLR